MNQAEQAEHKKKLLGYFKSHKYKKIIKHLTAHPELVLLKFNKERTLLHLAILYNIPKLVNHLLKEYPDLIFINDKNQATVFHYIIDYFHDNQIAEMLLKKTNLMALIHQKDKKNRCALQLVAGTGNPVLLALFKNYVFPNLVHHQADDANLTALISHFSKLNLFEHGQHFTSKGEPQRYLNLSPPEEDESINAFKYIQTTNNELEELESTLESTLLIAGFEALSGNLQPLNENILWNLCSGYNPVMPTQQELAASEPSFRLRQFDKEYTVNVLQGLLAEKNAIDIIAEIEHFWSQFDKNQKLTAIFIIKELLLWDVSHQLLRKETNVKARLESLMNKIAHDFSPFGTSLVLLISRMIKVKSLILKNKPFKKLTKLRNKSQEEQHVQYFESFEDLLLETVLIKKEKKQKPNIKRISNELSAITLGFYHSVNISEFYNAAWGKKHSRKAPHIKSHIALTNNLIAYIQSFILRAESAENCAARISLMIRVASQLCEENNGVGPDFGSITAIVLALNGFCIDRLKRCFALLGNEDLQRLQNLKNLVAPEYGYKAMRSVANASRLPLINPSLFQAEVTFAYESPCDKQEMLGKVLNRFLQLKRALQTIPFHYKTDLLYLLASKAFAPTWHQALCLSGRFEPMILDVVTFEELMEIIPFMINNNFFPKVSYVKVHYEPDCLVAPMLDKMKACLTLKEQEGDDIKPLLVGARKAALDLIAFSNSTFNTNWGIELIQEYLPKPSSKSLMKSRTMSFNRALDLINPPVYIVRRSPEASKRHSVVNKSPVLSRKTSFS